MSNALSPLSLGDFLTAVQRLEVKGRQTSAEVALLLGMEAPPEPPPLPLPVREAKSPVGQGASYPQPKSAEPRTPPSKKEPSLQPTPRGSILIEEQLTQLPPPQWLREVLPEESSGFGSRVDDDLEEHESLLSPSWSRAIVTAALARWLAEGDVHVEKMVESIATLCPLSTLPRRKLPTLRMGAQLLVDQSIGMMPFTLDQEQLLQLLSRLLHPGLLDVRYSCGAPAWQTGADEDDAYRLPMPGTPVLCLTDLGLGGPRLQCESASTEKWLAFAGVLARRGCPLVALLPYPKQRWPVALRRAMALLHWDRPLTVSRVQSAVRHRGSG